MILDTCFLIDLQRESKRDERGRTIVFLEAHPNTAFAISVISVTEFLEGFSNPDEGEVLLRSYKRLDLDSKVARQAALIRRRLRLTGRLIGDLDILIAASAIVEGQPLVTRNIDEFERVEGLEIVGY